MKTEMSLPPVMVFPRAVALAVAHLKEHLQHQFEHTYPGLDEIIRLVIAEEEVRAWELSAFPHLFLPDLVEAHLTKLGLDPAGLRREDLPVAATARAPILAAAC